MHDDAGDDPAVAEPDGFRAFRRPVVMPRHPEYSPAGRLNKVSSTATVSGDPAGNRWVTMRSVNANPTVSLDHRVARSAGHGEESVRAAVMPELLQAGAGEHPAHRSAASLTDQTNDEADERAEGGAVKQGRNTATRSVNEHGTVAPGSIDGSLSRGWCRRRRCSPLTLQDHGPCHHRRVAHDPPTGATPPAKMRNTRAKMMVTPPGPIRSRKTATIRRARRTRGTLGRGAGLLVTGLPVKRFDPVPIAFLRGDLFGCDAGSRAAQMSALRPNGR
jgi:hypothetical protein